MKSTKSTLIAAFGNPLRGDDGVGLVVLEALRQRPLGPHVELVDGGTAGLETALAFESRARIILIDAADSGQAPGTVTQYSLTRQELAAQSFHPNSLHAAGLKEALTLAAVLGRLPPQITLYCVQPMTLGYQTGLSEAVHKAVSHLVQTIADSIKTPAGR